jgi:hypothetical protein
MRGVGTQRPCCLVAWCWLRGDWIFPPSTQVRNCTVLYTFAYTYTKGHAQPRTLGQCRDDSTAGTS